MWPGFLEGIEKTSVVLLVKIKHLLLKLFPFLDSVGMYQGLIDNAASFVIRMAILAHEVEDRITAKELYKILKEMNEESRIHVIALIHKIGSENDYGWENLVLLHILVVLGHHSCTNGPLIPEVLGHRKISVEKSERALSSGGNSYYNPAAQYYKNGGPPLQESVAH